MHPVDVSTMRWFEEFADALPTASEELLNNLCKGHALCVVVPKNKLEELYQDSKKRKKDGG